MLKKLTAKGDFANTVNVIDTYLVHIKKITHGVNFIAGHE